MLAFRQRGKAFDPLKMEQTLHKKKTAYSEESVQGDSAHVWIAPIHRSVPMALLRTLLILKTIIKLFCRLLSALRLEIAIDSPRANYSSRRVSLSHLTRVKKIQFSPRAMQERRSFDLCGWSFVTTKAPIVTIDEGET